MPQAGGFGKSVKIRFSNGEYVLNGSWQARSPTLGAMAGIKWYEEGGKKKMTISCCSM